MNSSPREWIGRFGVPDAALSVIEKILNPDEIELIKALGSVEFDAAQAKLSLEESTGAAWPPEQVAALLPCAYRRGVINAAGQATGRYQVGSFYGRLDVFCVQEQAAYAAFPESTRKTLDEWYFDAYLKGLGDAPQPTRDRVISLEEALDLIDREERQIYRTLCDCRCLGGDCGMPLDTCLSMRSGPNTFADRGVSRPIGKEDAKEVVREAHAAGLMHTVNPNGLCNCCSDCCYLFRAQAARGGIGVWPEAARIAAFDAPACVGCGACPRRCPFEAFFEADGAIRYDAARCRGCGLCEAACPAGAIRMTARSNPPGGQ